MMSDSTETEISVETTTPKKDKWFRNRWAIGVCAFLVGMAAAAAGGSLSVADASSKTAAVQAKLDTAIANLDVMTVQRDTLADEVAQTTLEAEVAAVAPAPAEPVAEPEPTTFSDGTYLVGSDLPAGRYKGTPTGGSAYWQISKDANGDNIIANNNTEGPFYIQVKTGQFLEISGAEIHKVK